MSMGRGVTPLNLAVLPQGFVAFSHVICCELDTIISFHIGNFLYFLFSERLLKIKIKIFGCLLNIQLSKYFEAFILFEASILVGFQCF